jgi:hypothetical protein
VNNRKLAGGFGAILIVTGLLGLAHGPSPMSSATPYDVFHVAFGALGLYCSLKPGRAKAFNVGFGAIDLYQAVAQQFAWFPQDYFVWKPADQLLHVVIGGLLVFLGLKLD